MIPVKFKEANVVYAKDQKEYLPLPAFADERESISCWKLNFIERIKIFFTGRLWLRQLNFRNPLQAQSPTVDYPFERAAAK